VGAACAGVIIFGDIVAFTAGGFVVGEFYHHIGWGAFAIDVTFHFEPDILRAGFVPGIDELSFERAAVMLGGFARFFQTAEVFGLLNMLGNGIFGVGGVDPG